MENNKFYNSIADTYDEMISFEKSLKSKIDKFKSFITPEIKNAADCGCGTGADSIALSKLGLNVTAFDPSTEMINKAKVNADLNRVKIDFHNYSIKSIPDNFNNSFDLVVSFGNTFANVDSEIFNNSIRRCFDILKPGGTILIHILNYHKILREKNRIVNITKGKEHTFIRFYDFESDAINFNILRFNHSNPSDHQIITTKVYPYSKDNFQEALSENGFKETEYYSNLKFEPFNNETSKDLFIKANS